MNQVHLPVKIIKTLLLKTKIATLEEIKAALGTTSTMTVFRKLKKLSYVTSYSHSGKYYTLKSIPFFDEHGLWAYKGIYFSKFDTLLKTAKVLVDKSDVGFSSSEFVKILHVEVKKTLLCLFKKKQLKREKIGGSDDLNSRNLLRYQFIYQTQICSWKFCLS